MEACLRTVSYPCYRPVFSQTFSLSEGQECVVPDTLPDIASILYSSATPLIRSKDLSESRVRLEANVPARITCLGEDGTLFCMDVSIPFYLSSQEEGLNEDCACVVGLTLQHLDVRALNPRKLSVRAELQVRVECYCLDAVKAAQTPEEQEAALHTLEQSAEISLISAVTEKTFVLTDEYTLSDQMPDALEILAQDISLHTQEIKTVGSKLIASGRVDSMLLCRYEDGDVFSVAFQTDFSQIIETDCETEESTVELKLLPSGMYYEVIPGTEMRELAMELHLVAQVIVSKKQCISYLADAYSNAYPLQLHRELRCYSLPVRDFTLRENGRTLLETPEAVSRVISCRVAPLSADMDNGSVIVRFRVTLLYRSADRLCAAERICMQTFSSEETSASIRICGFTISEMNALPADNGVELRYAAELCAQSAEQLELNCISAVEWDEAQGIDTDDLPTLVLLRCSSSDSLWSIAKDHCSTVEEIRSANALEEAGESWEKLLIIPKAL